MKTKCKFLSLSIGLLITIAVLTACNSVNHNITQQPSMKYDTKTIEIVKDAGSIDAYEDKVFMDILYDEMSDEGFVKDAQSSFKIMYKITKYDPGSRAARFFGGIFGGGKGLLDVEAKYIDNNNVIAKTSTSIVFRGGSFGGSFENAFYYVADEIADFAGGKLKNKSRK